MTDARQHDPRQPGEESLEHLLSQAEWPQPSAESLTRLQQQWQRISDNEVSLTRSDTRPRRLISWLALMAIVILAAVTIFVWRFSGNVNLVQPHQPPRNEKDSGKKDSGKGNVDGEFKPDAKKYEYRASRPAENFEKLAFRLLLADSTTERPQRVEAVEPLSELVERLAGQDPIDWATVPSPAATPIQRQQQINELWRLIQREQTGVAQKQIAIQLLQRVGGRQAIRPLLALVASGPWHALAVREVAPLLPALGLGKLAQAETDTELKRLLLVQLLGNGTKQDIDIYLNFVWQPSTRELALSVIHDHPRPPIQILFRTIDSPRHRERVVAARALSHVCNPQVSQRLIQMALRGHRRNEAFLALIGCQDEQALSFLRQARNHQLYAASIRMAFFQLKSLP